MRPLSDIVVQPELGPLPLHLHRRDDLHHVFMEIGFGNGEYLVHLAGQNPGSTFWGVEMSRSCVLRAVRKIQRAGVDNAYLLCGDARFFLAECLEEGSLDGIYMNFPCPWPKRRHSKRRVSAGGFADDIARSLAPEGFFELVTDEEWYGREVARSLSSHPGLLEDLWIVNPQRSVTTKYERKWQTLGKDTYLSRTVRREWKPAPKPLKIGEGGAMHTVASCAFPAEIVLKGLYGQGGDRGEALWVYKRSFSSGDGVHLLEVIASDGAFEQKFILQIAERQSDLLVKIAPHSCPFLTLAVREALLDLGRRLESAGAPLAEQGQ